LLFGGQYWQHGAGAMLLFFVNVVCINLSGVVTFKLQGIEPKGWWEAKKAKRSAAVAIVTWFSLLLLLAAMIFFEQKLPV
jgi:uncharacterized membrane protein